MNVKKVLGKYNINPKKYRDQIFLADEKIQEKVVSFADLKGYDTVLEIGAGIGNLTEFISKRASVIAIERDSRLAAVLRHQNFPRTSILVRDAMSVRLRNLEFNKVVANLPYSVSTPLTFRLLRSDWDLAVLIYQKGFAERLVAGPGNTDYSRLSVAVNYYCDAEMKMQIDSEKFYPSPETDSAVVVLKKKDVEGESDVFWKIVKAAFQHKRKKVKNSLKDSAKFLGVEEGEIKSVENDLPDKRVYQCSFEEFESIEDLIGDKISTSVL